MIVQLSFTNKAAIELLTADDHRDHPVWVLTDSDGHVIKKGTFRYNGEDGLRIVKELVGMR